jgi:hypothetical protein
VGDRDNRRGLRCEIVLQCVGGSRQYAGTNSIAIDGPIFGADGQVINRGKNFRAKSVCGQWTALEIPRVGRLKLGFCFGMDSR